MSKKSYITLNYEHAGVRTTARYRLNSTVSRLAQQSLFKQPETDDPNSLAIFLSGLFQGAGVKPVSEVKERPLAAKFSGTNAATVQREYRPTILERIVEKMKLRFH